MKFVKSAVSFACVLAILCSLLCIAPLTASAISYPGAEPNPVQRQWDSKWKSYYIGGRTMYDTACGIFSIVNAVGFATGNTMDVMEVGRWAYSIKAFNYSSGGTTRGMLYPYLQKKYGSTYGFTVDCNGTQGYWAGSSSSKLKNHLESGGTAIAHVKGHFIAVVDYDRSTNKFRVFDSAPSSSRGSAVTGEYGYGDVWLSQNHLATTAKMTIDWFCLITPTGAKLNDGDGPISDNTADKIGTWQVNSKAPSTDKLNVRTDTSSSSDANIVGTVQEGDIVYTSELTGGSSNWGKIKNFATGVEGYASIMNHADYIGIDALGGTPSVVWGDVSATNDEYGQRTLVNHSSTETVGYDLYMPIYIGTETTPYMSLQITPNYGNGYYFGIANFSNGYFMLRDCSSGDQLVEAQTAPYMTNTEKLEIDLREWWKSADHKIDCVRIYLAPGTSITINYFYFAATKGKVTDATYNLIRQKEPIVNENIMDSSNIEIVDRSKKGSWSYNDGKLVVTADTDAGFEVRIGINKDYKPAQTPNWIFDLVATTGFDVQIKASCLTGDWDFGLVADFWPGLCDTLEDGYLPAETYYGVCDVYSCYTWNNIVPADGISNIRYVTVKLAGQGSVTLNSLQISNTTDIVRYADGIVKSDSSDSVKGDIDNDGVMSTQDVRECLKFQIGSVTFTEAQKSLADYDGDGTFTTADMRKMLKVLLG